VGSPLAHIAPLWNDSSSGIYPTYVGCVYHADVRLVPEMDIPDRSLAITYGQPELAHTCVLDDMTLDNLVSRSFVRCVHNLMGLQVDAPKYDLDDHGSL
jgi:hypothetical protein